MKELDYTQLSKEISYALRHAPWEYELELDEEGWVLVEQLIEVLCQNKKWEMIQEEHIVRMIEISHKKRHEIKNGKIRAFYGHSVPMKISKQEQRPPAILYHGTTQRALKSILENGLLPSKRQYVHLSKDIETAEEAGKRRDSNPVILCVDAENAFIGGEKFYLGNEKVWLSEYIPPQYLENL